MVPKRVLFGAVTALALGAFALALAGCGMWSVLTGGGFGTGGWTGGGPASINLTDSTCAGSGVSYADGVFTIANGAVVEVTGSTTSSRIVVNGSAVVTLSDASIDLSARNRWENEESEVEVDVVDPLDLSSGANLTLKLTGTNTLIAGFGGAGIHVPAGRALTITSGAGEGQTSGRLDVTGGGRCAGIGGGRREDGGAITISGGTVNATGGYQGAGIGGGGGYLDEEIVPGGAGGTIRITGGTVNAAALVGTGDPAAIGGGGYGNSGNVSILGGSGAAGGGALFAVGPGAYGSFGTFTGRGTLGVGGWPPLNTYKWDGQRGSVVVYFDGNGADMDPPAPQGDLPGTVITLPAATHYDDPSGFTGWFTTPFPSSSGINRAGGAGDDYTIPPASVTLYAHGSWQEQ